MINALTQRINLAVESLLDLEALTPDLEDAAATELLNWGITHAENIARSTLGMGDDEAELLISSQLGLVREWLRQISRWVTSYQEMAPQANAALLEAVIAQFSKIYPEYQPPNLEQKQAFLAPPFPEEPVQWILNLRSLIEGSQTSVNS
jgi:hypothetical protein